MLSITKAALTRAVTMTRAKEVMSQLGCLTCDQYFVDMSQPNVKKNERDPSTQFPVLWRDQVTANIHLAATPEGRSLTSL